MALSSLIRSLCEHCCDAKPDATYLCSLSPYKPTCPSSFPSPHYPLTHYQLLTGHPTLPTSPCPSIPLYQSFFHLTTSTYTTNFLSPLKNLLTLLHHYHINHIYSLYHTAKISRQLPFLPTLSIPLSDALLPQTILLSSYPTTTQRCPPRCYHHLLP